MSVSTTPVPDTIVRTAIGYMAAKQLFASSRIGLFRALDDGPKTHPELAAATGVSERNARILADAMASLGLLDRKDGGYSLTTETAAYLGPQAELDLGPFLHFLDTLSFPHWTRFYDRTVDENVPGDFAPTTGQWSEFLAGVQRYNDLHAAMLAREFDFTPFRRLLDFGGLSPAFSIGGLKQNPQLQATVVYAESFADAVREAIDAAGLSDRATVKGAPTEDTVPEGSYDLVLASHVIHRFDAETNQRIFANLRQAAEPGTTLLVLDFYLDHDDQQRAIDALHAGEYFVIDGTVVYPLEEVEGWLTDAGWKPAEMLALPGAPRVLIATAV